MKKVEQVISVLVGCWLVLLTISSMVQADASVVVKTYNFDRPSTEEVILTDDQGRQFQFIELQIPGCRTVGMRAGEPRLPIRSVCLALPQGAMLDRVEVAVARAETIPLALAPAPQQAQYPLSKPETAHYTPPSDGYEGTKSLPDSVIGSVNFQRCKGYNLAYLNLHAVQWNPETKELIFYPSITVSVHTKPLAADFSTVLCRGLDADRQWVARMVDNPELLTEYRAETAARDNYSYVIITNQALAGAVGPNNFQGLAQHKSAFGQTTYIETVENIYASYIGVDNQQKIRNFIINAYNNWNTEYVVLGGDGDVSTAGGESGNSIVPTRGFYVTESGYTDSRIPADLYYSCLDGTFNNDNDSRWGEPTDGPSGGDVDLAAEVYVGRICVDSSLELNRMIAKTIQYETTSSDSPWLKQALMVGELLWDKRSDRTTYGGDYKDEIKFGSNSWGYSTAGFPLDYTVGTLYDRDLGSWGSSQLLQILNSNNLHVLNHLGHSDVDYNMRLYNSHADNLTATNPWFGYSQGCLCGAFDNLSDSGSQLTYDCILEHFTVNDAGPFAYVGNARYGWGAYDSTDGASQYFDRQFFDAIFSEEIVNLGKANADSKEDTIPWINVDCHRWCYYELNLFGDPHTIFGGGTSRDGFIQLDRNVYPTQGSLTVQVTDLDLNVNASLPDATTVTVETNLGDVETLTLVETAAASCVFSGSLTLAAATPQSNNGTLEVAHECTITATYLDANTGHGGLNVPKTADAQVDGVAPTITDVTIVTITDTLVTISWATDEPADSTITYGIDPPYNVVRTTGLTRLHVMTITNLLPCTLYRYTIGSCDAAGNLTVDDNNGNYYLMVTWDQAILLDEPMDFNPGWVTSGGQWGWGVPTGSGGEHGCPDPTAGFTGTAVYGYNLNGDYPNNMQRYNLTMGPIDCSQATTTKIQFMRWLGVERNQYDHACFEISTNGLNWTTLWANGTDSIADGQWLLQDFDVAELADGQATVYFRWGLGPSDTGWMYCGWNIDDVKIFYSVPCDIPTPTSVPTETPEPTPTVLPTSTPIPTLPPTIIPPTPTPYSPPDPQIDISLNQTTYHAGDLFRLSLTINNSQRYLAVDQFVILDVWGIYYFSPQWTTDLDWVTRMLDPTSPVHDTILEFVWPSGAGSAHGLRFWAALCQTGNLTLLGEIDTCDFAFE